MNIMYEGQSEMTEPCFITIKSSKIDIYFDDIYNSYMSSIQSPNLFLLVAFSCRLLSNRVWPVKRVRSNCDAL